MAGEQGGLQAQSSLKMTGKHFNWGDQAKSDEILRRSIDNVMEELSKEQRRDSFLALAWMIADEIIDFKLAKPIINLTTSFTQKSESLLMMKEILLVLMVHIMIAPMDWRIMNPLKCSNLGMEQKIMLPRKLNNLTGFGTIKTLILRFLISHQPLKMILSKSSEMSHVHIRNLNLANLILYLIFPE